MLGCHHSFACTFVSSVLWGPNVCGNHNVSTFSSFHANGSKLHVFLNRCESCRSDRFLLVRDDKIVFFYISQRASAGWRVYCFCPANNETSTSLFPRSVVPIQLTSELVKIEYFLGSWLNWKIKNQKSIFFAEPVSCPGRSNTPYEKHSRQPGQSTAFRTMTFSHKSKVLYGPFRGIPHISHHAWSCETDARLVSPAGLCCG